MEPHASRSDPQLARGTASTVQRPPQEQPYLLPHLLPTPSLKQAFRQAGAPWNPPRHRLRPVIPGSELGPTLHPLPWMHRKAWAQGGCGAISVPASAPVQLGDPGAGLGD